MKKQGLIGSRDYVRAHFGACNPAPAARTGAQRGARLRSWRSSAGQGGRGGCQTGYTLTPEHAKFAGYFNIDNGTGAIRGVYLQQNDAVAPIFREWMEPFRSIGMTSLTIRNTGGTDHQSFDAPRPAGLPVHPGRDRVRHDDAPHEPGFDDGCSPPT